VTDYRNVMPVLERMEKIGMPFLMHGEDVDPDVDIFDREAMIIERYLAQVGARHYRLPPNEDTITLEKSAWTAPPEVDIEGPDERALIYRGGETIEWKICA
jgi:dihydroorotase